MNFSILKSVGSFCDTLERITDLNELYEIITDEESEAAKLHALYNLGVIKKDRLHSAFFSCSFDRYKKAEEISEAEYTPLLCFDFDKIHSSLFSYIYEILEEDQYTRLIFKSPSGNGIKVIVEAKSSLKDHEGVYNTLIYYYEELTGVEVDSSCKNINRACFLPYAPDAVYKEDSVIYEVPKLVKIPPKVDASKIKDLESKETEEALALARRWVEDKGVKFEEGKRNIYIYRFACNCNRLGISPEAVIDYIKDHYSGDAEFKEVVNKCYKLNKAQFKQNAYKAKEEQKPVILQATKEDERFYKKHPFFKYHYKGVKYNIEAFIKVHKNALPIIRQGRSLEEFKAFVNQELNITNDELINNYYDYHKFIYSTINQKSDYKYTILKDNQTICDEFVEQHLKPRYNTINRVYEYRSFSGEYETFTKRESKNTVEKILTDYYLIKNIDSEKSVRLKDIEQYNPFVEFLEKHKNSNAENLYYLPDLFYRYNRFYVNEDQSKEKQEKELERTLNYIFKCFTVFYVHCIWQALGIRKNEMALGAVSRTQFTGKSYLMRMIRKPLEELGLTGEPSYDTHTPDGIRPMISKIILHDDELSIRGRKDIKAYKNALSCDVLAYTEKYESQITNARRICSYTFCTNNNEYLQEDSRRDFIIRFAEDRDVNFDDLTAELEKNIDKLNKAWGYAYDLATDPEKEATILKMYREIVDVGHVRNKEHRESTPAGDVILKLFALPLDSEVKPLHYKSFTFSVNLDDDRRNKLTQYDIYIIDSNRREDKRQNFIINSTEIQAIIKANYNIQVTHADIKKTMQELGFKYATYRDKYNKNCKGYLIQPSEGLEIASDKDESKEIAAKANKAETGGAAANITYVSEDSDEVPF